jgi:hypothetical protein
LIIISDKIFSQYSHFFSLSGEAERGFYFLKEQGTLFTLDKIYQLQ